MDNLSLDLEKLRVSSAQSDVTIKVKSKEYRVHRAILSARSDSLASALTHDMSETGVITVEDCDSDSFQEFLRYLYTSRADINEENVFHLYRTADKYLVNELKSHCVAFLMENLSVNSFCNTVALAWDYRRCELLNYCKTFFLYHATSIFLIPDFKSLIGSHREAVSDLLQYYGMKHAY